MKSPLGLDAKLPVLELLKQTLLTLWWKRSDVIRLFLPVMILMAVLDFIARTYFQTDTVQEGVSMSNAILQVIVLVFTILMATAAHKFTLLPREQWPSNALRLLGINEIRYFVRVVQIGVIGAAIVIGVILVSLVFGKQAFPIGLMFGAMIAIYVSGRLSITLPEIALGRFSQLNRAWDMGKGNGSMLVIVVVVLPMLLTVPFMIPSLLTENGVLRFIATFATYIGSLISVTVLSLSYQFLLDFYEPSSSYSDDGDQSRDDSTEVAEKKSDHDSFDA